MSAARALPESTYQLLLDAAGTMNDQSPRIDEPIITGGAGPVGCTAALLLADSGIAVTVLERRTQPYPLPRAVHLDDEVARTLFEEYAAHRKGARGEEETGWFLLGRRGRA